MEKLVLTYWRCADCLDAFTLPKGTKADECACGGKVEIMGNVETGHEVEEHLRSACDDRCTHAAGPHCICKCNCANHGTGKIKKVILIDGKYKVENFCEKNLTVAKDFRDAYKTAEARFLAKFGEDIVAKFSAGKYLNDHKTWFEIRAAKIQMSKIKNMKVHKKRMQLLESFLGGALQDAHETNEVAKMIGGS